MLIRYFGLLRGGQGPGPEALGLGCRGGLGPWALDGLGPWAPGGPAGKQIEGSWGGSPEGGKQIGKQIASTPDTLNLFLWTG